MLHCSACTYRVQFSLDDSILPECTSVAEEAADEVRSGSTTISTINNEVRSNLKGESLVPTCASLSRPNIYVVTDGSGAASSNDGIATEANQVLDARFPLTPYPATAVSAARRATGSSLQNDNGIATEAHQAVDSQRSADALPSNGRSSSSPCPRFEPSENLVTYILSYAT